MEPENNSTTCFLCKKALTKSENGGTYCPNCAKLYDPGVYEVDNIYNCSGHKNLLDGRQNVCMKIFGPRNQHWYQCSTCFPKNKAKGCCIFCSKVCHEKGHVLEIRYSPFVCDK